MKNLILLLSFLTFICSCSEKSNSNASGANPLTLNEFKIAWTKQSADCLIKADQAIAIAKRQEINSSDVSNLQWSIERPGCAKNICPEQLLTKTFTVNSDYLAQRVQFEYGVARISSLRIWFTHQLVEYSDSLDPNIKHQGWTTWKYPVVVLRIQNNSNTNLTYSPEKVLNYSFTNPLETVKTQTPSFANSLDVFQEGKFDVSLNIQDKTNALATTWIAEFDIQASSLETASKWREIRMLEYDIVATFAGITGFKRYNDVQSYEKIKYDLLRIQDLLNTL